MSAYPTPTREAAASLDDRAEIPHRVPQWETADGTARYAVIRALSVRDMMDAERAAMEKGRDGAWASNPYRLMVEVVRRGIVSPPNLGTEVIYGWNYAAVLDLYAAIEGLGGYVAARVAKSLAALAGEPAPPVAAAAPARRSDSEPADLGDDDRATEEDPAGEPAEPVAG